MAIESKSHDRDRLNGANLLSGLTRWSSKVRCDVGSRIRAKRESNLGTITPVGIHHETHRRTFSRDMTTLYRGQLVRAERSPRRTRDQESPRCGSRIPNATRTRPFARSRCVDTVAESSALAASCCRSASARTHRLEQSGMHPELSQRMLRASGTLPPNPEAFPDVSSDPALQPEDQLAHLGHSETSPSASYVSAPGIAQLIAGANLVAPPHLPRLRLESFDTLRRYSDPLVAIQSKTQELAFPNPPGPALAAC
jgi:hypothetical protein